MRMRVNESRRDRFSFHVEYFCTCGNAALRAHALDTIVFDDDVGVFQHLIALHRHNSCAAENDRSLRRFPRNF